MPINIEIIKLANDAFNGADSIVRNLAEGWLDDNYENWRNSGEAKLVELMTTTDEEKLKQAGGEFCRIRALILELKELEREMREAALEELIDIGLPAVKPLVATLVISTPKNFKIWRGIEETIFVLGEIGDPEAVDALALAFNCKNDYVHEELIDALQKIGKPAVEPLIAALSKNHLAAKKSYMAALKNRNERKGLINALVRLKDPRAIAPVNASNESGMNSWAAGLAIFGTVNIIGSMIFLHVVSIGDIMLFVLAFLFILVRHKFMFFVPGIFNIIYGIMMVAGKVKGGPGSIFIGLILFYFGVISYNLYNADKKEFEFEPEENK